MPWVLAISMALISSPALTTTVFVVRISKC
jgi:hypothetical protein